MEEQQQILVGMTTSNNVTGKGKRTKRLRQLLSPCGVAATTVTTASSCSSVSGGGGDIAASFSSTESTDQEEEDMANCLILLAQGGSQSHHHHHHQKKQPEHGDDDGEKTEKSNTAGKRFAEVATTATNPNTNTKIGFFIYECKTCNRTFPSFQALGGHRASHKRPKMMVEEKKLSPTPPPLPAPPPPPPSSQPHQLVMNYGGFEEAGPLRGGGPSISLQLGRSGFHPNNKAKIHECSICGSEFTSGQALGGHMRRHRASAANTTAETNSNAITATSTTTVARPPRNILQLDLNLPAPPEDDLRESKFQFPATQKSMVLSAAPALVDCHY